MTILCHIYVLRKQHGVFLFWTSIIFRYFSFETDSETGSGSNYFIADLAKQ